MQKKYTLIALVIGLGLLVLRIFLTPQSEKSQQEPTKVRVSSMPVVQGLPLYLALEKGYFKEVGLDVEFVKFESPNQIIDALLQGQIDITPPSAATGVVGVADAKNPGKLKIYSWGGGSDQVQNDAILVANNSQIKNIRDLKGKKLGLVAGSTQWRIFTTEILSQNGLVAGQDVQLIELALGIQPQALSAGQVDAILTVEPVPTLVKSASIGAELEGFAAARFISNPFYSGVGVIRADFAKQEPEAAQKILAVFSRAIDEINLDPDSARQYLKTYTPLDDSTIKVVPISVFKMNSKLDSADFSAIRHVLSLFHKYKAVDTEIDLDKLLYIAQ